MMPNISMSLSDINGPLSMCVYDLHFLYIVCMDCAKFCLLDILSSETAQIWGFPVFSWECVGVMTWNLACWCIMTTYRKKNTLVTVCWFSSAWRHFHFVRLVKFETSFLRMHGSNGFKFGMLVYPDHLDNFQIWVVVQWFFSFWHQFDLLKLIKFEVPRNFRQKQWEEWPGISHTVESWLPSELIGSSSDLKFGMMM